MQILLIRHNNVANADIYLETIEIDQLLLVYFVVLSSIPILMHHVILRINILMINI
jgi:hypothetical protein